RQRRGVGGPPTGLWYSSWGPKSNGGWGSSHRVQLSSEQRVVPPGRTARARSCPPRRRSSSRLSSVGVAGLSGAGSRGAGTSATTPSQIHGTGRREFCTEVLL